MPIEQKACYLEWMPRLVVTSRVHQYFSAEADFTCPLMLVGWDSTKSAFVRGALNRLAAFRFTPLRACAGSAHLLNTLSTKVNPNHSGR